MPLAANDNTTHKAIWIPSWYELDQPLRVGQVGRFLFYRDTPEWVANVPAPLNQDFDLVFFNQLLAETPWEARTGLIQSIEHPELGPLLSVDTYGLDYTFQLHSGTTLSVNAEEDPGWCQQLEPGIKHWGLQVYLGQLSNPLTREGMDPSDDPTLA